MKENAQFIVISGPTAVGKSALALQLAMEFDLPIISADSRQVFREMSIGTAKPSIEDRLGVPHFWMDEKSITEHVSAGTFVRNVERYLDEHNISTAILCGGTQFYIESLLYGLDKMPSIPDTIRTEVQRLYTLKGIRYLQDYVRKNDELYYEKVDKDNPRRLLRAVELMETSGKPYSSFINSEKRRLPRYRKIAFFLSRPREILYERINKRVETMFSVGLVEEAHKLYRTQKDNKNLHTVGYQELFQYFSGNIGRDEAIRLIKRNTRRYAKRQLTWYRKNRFRYIKRNVDRQESIRQAVALFLLGKHIQ